ncbi:MAG: peptidyl-tRNA hydrolase [Blastocatellia bacterium]|nr:peptidyl-tRNA hydrolase [Blastocatellia bacterium]
MTEAELKLYILVRRDLPGTQPAVQACHALAELMMEWGNDP